MSEHPFAKQSCVGGAARAVILRLETRWRSRVREAGAYRPKFGDLNLHIKAPAGFFQKAKVKLSRGNYISSHDLGDIPLLIVTPSAIDFRLGE